MEVNNDLTNLKNNMSNTSEKNKFIEIPVRFNELSEKISILFINKEVDVSKVIINFYCDVIVSTSPIVIYPEVNNLNEISFSLDYNNIPFKLNIGKFDIFLHEKLIQTVLIQIVKDKNIFYKNLLY